MPAGNRPLLVYRHPRRCSQHPGEAVEGDARGLRGQAFWTRGPGLLGQQSCSGHLRTPCSGPGAALKLKTDKVPAPAHDRESFRAQPDTRHLT